MSGIISTLFFNTDYINTSIQFHSKYKVIFVTKGSSEIYLNDNIYNLNENDIIFLSNCEYFSIKTTSLPCHRYVLVLSSDDFLNEFDNNSSNNILALFKYRPHNSNCVMHLKNPADVENLFKKMMLEQKNPSNIYSEQITRLYLHELFIHALRSSSQPVCESFVDINNKILQGQKLIEDNYTHPIKITDICNELSVSLYYFTHQFTSIVGCSPKQYLMKIRLNHAGRLLTDTNLTINQIASQTGFPDAKNFIKYFKMKFQLTPTAFRKQNRSKT